MDEETRERIEELERKVESLESAREVTTELNQDYIDELNLTPEQRQEREQMARDLSSMGTDEPLNAPDVMK